MRITLIVLSLLLAGCNADLGMAAMGASRALQTGGYGAPVGYSQMPMSCVTQQYGQMTKTTCYQ